jgi:hypothetical protein
LSSSSSILSSTNNLDSLLSGFRSTWAYLCILSIFRSTVSKLHRFVLPQLAEFQDAFVPPPVLYYHSPARHNLAHDISVCLRLRFNTTSPDASRRRETYSIAPAHSQAVSVWNDITSQIVGGCLLQRMHGGGVFGPHHRARRKRLGWRPSFLYSRSRAILPFIAQNEAIIIVSPTPSFHLLFFPSPGGRGRDAHG